MTKNATGGSIDLVPFCTDLGRPLGGVHHSAYFSYQNRNVCLFAHCLNLISPPPLPTSLSVTPPHLSSFLCSHSKLKEGERAKEKRLFSGKRHRDERLPTQSVIAGKMGVMCSRNESRKESADFGTPTHEMWCAGHTSNLCTTKRVLAVPVLERQTKKRRSSKPGLELKTISYANP